MNRILLDSPDDPCIKFSIEATATGVCIVKEHTSRDTVTVSDNVTVETLTITRTRGLTENF